MNIEQQHLNFQRAYVKTDCYKIYCELTKTTNSTFSWNNEANRYTRHDVNSAWEMWLSAQQQEGYVLVPVEPTKTMIRVGEISNTGYDNIDAKEVYKTMLQVAQE